MVDHTHMNKLTPPTTTGLCRCASATVCLSPLGPLGPRRVSSVEFLFESSSNGSPLPHSSDKKSHSLGCSFFLSLYLSIYLCPSLSGRSLITVFLILCLSLSSSCWLVSGYDAANWAGTYQLDDACDGRKCCCFSNINIYDAGDNSSYIISGPVWGKTCGSIDSTSISFPVPTADSVTYEYNEQTHVMQRSPDGRTITNTATPETLCGFTAIRNAAVHLSPITPIMALLGALVALVVAKW